MKIAVLALQGAFIEHEQMLTKLGVESFEIRQKKDIDQPFDGLILPGGESTVMGKLLHESGLFEPIQQKILNGLPVLGTCAGLILLAEQVEQERSHLETMHITVKRNAYGRQLGSFYTEGQFKGLGIVPMTFIRAPYIASVAEGVEVLAEVDGKIVAAREGRQLACAFHPELNDNTAIHRYFIDMITEN